MANVKSLLAERLKKKEKSSKMEKMAEKSANGNLTSFSGVFSISELNSQEKSVIEEILLKYSSETSNIEKDLHSLISITSEVKAITNQAILLHGERIKKTQTLLKNYQEGAFSAWLIATYGNRQTPYNFLQYYEFFHRISPSLRTQLELMPRQAIYTLASREGPIEKKETVIKNYQGETKNELLALIREIFPLSEEDGRQQNFGESAITALKRLSITLNKGSIKLDDKQKLEITELLDHLYQMISP